MSVKRGTQLNSESDTDLSEDERRPKLVRYRQLNESIGSVVSQEQSQSQLKEIVRNCTSLQREFRKEGEKLYSNQARQESFFEDYQRLLEFKRESGWYEHSKETTQRLLKNPRFTLPSIGEKVERKKPAASDLANFLVNQQAAQMGLDRDARAEQKKQRANMDFLRSDLTDAENFINISRVQPFQIN